MNSTSSALSQQQNLSARSARLAAAIASLPDDEDEVFPPAEVVVEAPAHVPLHDLRLDLPVSRTFRDALPESLREASPQALALCGIILLRHDRRVPLDYALRHALWGGRHDVSTRLSHEAHIDHLIEELGWSGIQASIELVDLPRGLHSQRKLRVLVVEQVPTKMQAIANEEVEAWWARRDEQVALTSGKRINATMRRIRMDAQRDELRADIAASMAGIAPGCPAATQGAIRGYLCEVPRQACTIDSAAWESTLAYVDRVYPAPADISSDEANTARAKRRQVMLALRAVYLSGGVEQYTPSRSGKTCRIYARGWSQLSQELRAMLRPRSAILDLDSAHARIIAYRWGATEAQRYIEQCDAAKMDVWTCLARDVLSATTLQLTERAAKALRKSVKTCTHRADCGMLPLIVAATMSRELRLGLADCGADLTPQVVTALVQAYQAHPYIRSLDTAREVRVMTVRAEGRVVCPSGRRIDIPYCGGEHAAYYAAVYSALSAEIHEIEAEIKLAVYRYAQRHGADGVRVLGDEHDGVTLVARLRREEHLAAIRAAVIEAGEIEGVQVRVTIVEARDIVARCTTPAEEQVAREENAMEEQDEIEEEAAQGPLGRDQGAQTDLALREASIAVVAVPAVPGPHNDWRGYGAGQAWTDSHAGGIALDDGWMDPASAATAHVVGEGVAERLAVASG